MSNEINRAGGGHGGQAGWSAGREGHLTELMINEPNISQNS